MLEIQIQRLFRLNARLVLQQISQFHRLQEHHQRLAHLIPWVPHHVASQERIHRILDHSSEL